MINFAYEEGIGGWGGATPGGGAKTNFVEFLICESGLRIWLGWHVGNLLEETVLLHINLF